MPRISRTGCTVGLLAAAILARADVPAPGIGAIPTASAAAISPAVISLRGVWAAKRAPSGLPQPLLVALQEDASGDVSGYVLGGHETLVIDSGQLRDDGRLELELELDTPGGYRVYTIRGELRGDVIAGRIGSGSEIASIQFQRVRAEIEERRMLLAELDASGEPVRLYDVGVATLHGRFVAGSFAARQACGALGCAGVVTGYSEASGSAGESSVAIGLASPVACPGSGGVDFDFDAAVGFYVGSFEFTDCDGSRTGLLIGTGRTRTTAAHLQRVLATFARLATDLERRAGSGPPFTAPYRPFADDYLHQSEPLATRLGELNEEISTYRRIDAGFSRYRNLHTVEDPFITPQLPHAFAVDFHDRRLGRTASAKVVYRDADTMDGADTLRYLAQRGDDWVFRGNQISHDLPFADYAVAADHVAVRTPGGDIYVSMGTWGAHSPPHTGHLDGDTKANWIGYYAIRDDQMTELAGDGDGVCAAGETCGVSVGELIARSVNLTAPADDFIIHEVLLARLHPPGLYFGGLEHWELRGSLGAYTFDFGHLRRIGADLRNAMIAAGYVDPWTVHSPSENLIAGPPVTLSEDQTIALPQIVATPVPGHPGFFMGGGSSDRSPWQQIEFFTSNEATSRAESFYTWLPGTLRDGIAAALENEAFDPLSFRYVQPFLAGLEFQTLAEMALSNQDYADRDDYSSIHTSLGGWWEGLGSCPATAPECDEIFSIFPIRKDTAFYEPGLYHSPEVSYLAIHAVHDPAVDRNLYGEVIGPFEPDPTTGSMVLRWRNRQGLLVGYQAVSYRLDAAGAALRIRWGEILPSEALASAALPPVPDNTDACDEATLTCHNHEVKHP
jgi:hypothetical protein